jgi:hypothetical protein
LRELRVKSVNFPVLSPLDGNFAPETGAIPTGSSASQSCLCVAISACGGTLGISGG